MKIALLLALEPNLEAVIPLVCWYSQNYVFKGVDCVFCGLEPLTTHFVPYFRKVYLKPAIDFSNHALVKPKIYHGREKRQISTSRKQGAEQHIHDLVVELDIHGVKHILDLRLNRDLLPKDYFRRYQQDGGHVVDRPSSEDVELCQYQGKIRGIPDSWAAMSTCRKGLSGVIFDGKEMHHIESASRIGSNLEDLHYVYKHSDLLDTNKTCAYEGTHESHQHQATNFNRLHRHKRATEPVIRGPYNANKRSRYVELVLVVDNKEYKDMGENLNRVYQHCKEIANIINGLYSSLNIFIALVGIVVWTEHDEIDLSTSGDQTLTNFLHYRRQKLIKEHPNDNAQLLTKFVFSRGVVGKALKGPICTFEYSGGVSMDHSAVVSLVATTVAHEMGHNFGMEHDTNDCQCPEERCIMAPSSSHSWPTHWSSCSLEYLALAFERGMDYCLRNKPKALFDSPVCGNGFVEPGEQCDCGRPDTCDNTCCNATTCMLYANASCATGECCDLKTCRPKSAGSLCRAADYECDLPEYCTGQSEYCPADIYKMDTEICDSGKAFCYQGSCRTRSDQCKLLWGNTGQSSDEQCYHMNTKGSRHGNCGYLRVNQTYIKCDDENVLCGMLHCRHLNERLEFGMESVAILSQTFINLKGAVIPCRTAIVDLGINQVDPGLAPDGAKCGLGKMCVNQKCMAVESLRANINSCPHDCNGNGVCNSLGHCHCKDGFAPPFCDYPGPGGSEDSGPASDPNARKEFVMAMYIVFLGIIPLMAIAAFLLYYTKYNVNFKWTKASPTLKAASKPRSAPPFGSDSSVRVEDNSSLLQEQHAVNGVPFQSEFFGQFKGFKLLPSPKPEEGVANTMGVATNKPQRSAPPVPAAVPTIPQHAAKSTTQIRRVHPSASCPVNNPVVRSHSDKLPAIANAIFTANSTSLAPALPPLNPGSNPRPLISSPILETSTCTAKELLSPLRTAPRIPLRPVPASPRPLSSPNTMINTISVPDEPSPMLVTTINSTTAKIKTRDTGGGGSGPLTRIASFLRARDERSKTVPSNFPISASVVTGTNTNPNSLPRNANIKANKILDKNALRSIEISGPIPQSDIEVVGGALPVPAVDDKDKTKSVVMRAQSMRGAVVTPRPAIPNFGSMRQPNFKRPTSIPVTNRPKSPPPPRPPLPDLSHGESKVPSLPGYQKSVKVNATQQRAPDYQYDDCMNEVPSAVPPCTSAFSHVNDENSPHSSDNIYAVIEESPKPLETVRSASGSSESVGLLGEIVSEIQNRNFDSIYSTSTMARKQKELLDKQQNTRNEKESGSDGSDTYVNTSAIYKSPESVYSNMSNIKSSASSTASGYIHPSAVNAPKTISTETMMEQSAPTPLLSTFKSTDSSRTDHISLYKPFASTLQRGPGPFASTFKTNSTSSKNEDVMKTSTSSSSIVKSNNPKDKQVLGTNLRKPSPTRTPPSTNSNSPDLVISCSNTPATNTKSPDVLNSSAKVVAKSNGEVAKAHSITTKVSPKVTKSSGVKKPLVKSSEVKPALATKMNKATLDAGAKTLAPGARVAAKQTSHVAVLQQRFESKPPIAAKIVPKKK